ncbi:efflux RND transporter periplasmic adaptor subunit [Croceibacterium sp. LX-88]|uniref:Efflux RND transporter periplasmic adaptor subunit n=1 Tax=Croceibacterium selenioxidans TaxID=2838833 RepID=A0ABS5W948_9SPHN|nr:efflux RND transporter periplasmic adaptor subunit [Croceibacterium selenioxidans]MBT2135735.1 efflux RND transporter periplasmic adaptor subunit [Croceibacterium selenioxidans]
MELQLNRLQLIAVGAAGALALTAGGYFLGRTLSSAPQVEAADNHEEEEGHGPEGFIAMTADRARTAGIAVEQVKAGGLASEILAQGIVAPTPAGEAVLTARADGAIVRINRRLGEFVRAGDSVAIMESRDAAALSSERSSAEAQLALARSAYEREQRLYEARVTARQDLEGARAALSQAEAEARRARSAASAAKLSGDGRTLSVVSLISGRITRADAKLGAFVPAGTELFRVADPSRIQINASVLATDARRIQPGDRAVIELPDGEGRGAVVRSITPGLDPESKTATVVLEPEGSGGLSQGQGLRARILPVTADTSRIALPEEAVQSFEGRDVVFVRTPNGFQAANVAAGQRGGGRIEIIEGLRPGTVVATRGAFLLKAELGKGEAEH